MRGGGVIEGEHWRTKVRLLRPGDCFQADHYGGDWEGDFALWGGGDARVVIAVESEGDGWFEIASLTRDVPEGTYFERYSSRVDRFFSMRGDDEVTLVSREVRERVERTLPLTKKQKEKVAKKAVQLKLF